MDNSNIVVLSLGGSLINPSEIDTAFLKSFKSLLEKNIKKGGKYIIIVGGGKPARQYQAALRDTAKVAADSLDWMGIYATRLNAHLVRLAFGKLAHSAVIEDPNKKVLFKEKILVAGGWMPGRSTDDDAVRLAKTYGAKLIINLTNIDFVYDKDPHKFNDAKPFAELSWDALQKIVGTKWNPGKNAPFDPTAVKTAKKYKLSVVIANGKDLKNLGKILQGKKYTGTTIQ